MRKVILMTSCMLVLMTILQTSCEKFNYLFQDSSGEPPTASNTGLIIIDVQKIALPGHEEFADKELVKDYMEHIHAMDELDKIVELSLLAGQKSIPTITTCIMADTGAFAMPNALIEALPVEAQSFTKLVFDHTKDAQILSAMETSGIKNWIVVGNKTDVCVLQSVLGMLDKGYNVYVVEDAIYSTGTNQGAIIKRMLQAGAHFTDYAQVRNSLLNQRPIVSRRYCPALVPSKRIVLDQLAVLHFAGDQSDFQSAKDPYKEEKAIRINKLFRHAELFELPIFAEYKGDGSPMSLPPNAIMLDEDGLEEKLPQFMDQLESMAVKQLIISGYDEDMEIIEIASEIVSQGIEVFFVHDGVISEVDNECALIGLISEGIVPTTEIAFFFEAFESLDYASWMTQYWYPASVQLYGDPWLVVTDINMPQIY